MSRLALNPAVTSGVGVLTLIILLSALSLSAIVARDSGIVLISLKIRVKGVDLGLLNYKFWPFTVQKP